jgi:hypothetical protein
MEKRFIGSENFHFISNYIVCPNLCENCMYFTIKKGASSYGDYHCDLSKVQGDRSSATFHEYSNPHGQKTLDKCVVFVDKNETGKSKTDEIDLKGVENKPKKEISDKEYKKVVARLEYYERMRDIEHEMIQKYLSDNKDKKIVEQIKAKGKTGFLLKLILSIVAFLSLYIVYKMNVSVIFMLAIILFWFVFIKIIGNKILSMKRKIASSEMPERKIVFKDVICDDVSIWDYKILDYISSPEGKEWLNTKYNK